MAEGIIVAPRMSEPVTQQQFFAALSDLRQHLDEKHSSLREYISERTEAIETKLDKHVLDDNAVRDRVLVIETKSGSDARWSGGIVAVLVTCAGWLINWLRH